MASPELMGMGREGGVCTEGIREQEEGGRKRERIREGHEGRNGGREVNKGGRPHDHPPCPSSVLSTLNIIYPFIYWTNNYET